MHGRLSTVMIMSATEWYRVQYPKKVYELSLVGNDHILTIFTRSISSD